MRPEADPMGITREGGSAPGLWEALWVQPSRGFDTRLCAQRGLGDCAVERSAGGSGMVVAVRVCVYGSPRDLWRGSPWGRRWRMEERGELVRRAGEGGNVVCTARWCWQGVVRETSPMPGRHQPRCHRGGEAPARCSHELQGHSPSG